MSTGDASTFHLAPQPEMPPVDLAHDRSRQTMPAKLAARLARVSGDILPVPKAGYNQDQNYWYQRSGDVSLAVRNSLAQHGVVLLWEPVSIHWRNYKTVSNRDAREATIWYTATFIDSETGEQYSIRWPGIATDLQDKVLAKCATAALKTFLITQFQIPSDEADNDQTQERERPARAAGGRQEQATRSAEKLVGTITEFERKGSGARLTVKDKKLWAGPIMAKKFPDDAKGKGCALNVIERVNDQGPYLEVVAVLSVTDKTTSASELVPPPFKPPTQPTPPTQPPQQQPLPTGDKK
jgi:ERF superfamily